MMRKNPTKKPYFLLDEVQRLDDNLFQSLLGLAIHKPYAPIQGDHAPITTGESSLKARDADESLYPPQPTYIRDATLMRRTTKSRRAKARLDRFLDGLLEKGDENNDTIETPSFRRVSIRNAPTTIANLLREDQPVPEPVEDAGDAGLGKTSEEPTSFFGGIAQAVMNTVWPGESGLAEAERKEKDQLNAENDAKVRKLYDEEMARRKYRDQVLALLKAKKNLGIVVSFITCADMARDSNIKKHAAAEAGAGIPLKEAAGIPLNVDAKVSASSSSDVGASGTYEGEYLIACSYLPLEKRERGGLSSLWFSTSEDSDWILGKDAAWRLGIDPMEGRYAAPMGPGDGEHEVDDDSCSIVLLHPDDRIGENTGAKEMDDDSEDESESESESNSDEGP
ncbi:hypothetical protein QBC47DRAFT_395870 [Echria macrotheca]|uniref:Uncharacterized protein n=1 Tax=Echria macrotheca TaxID=438768 RepID=A0AAJ0F3I5_9PEZI|nr:hypothetical protein QBC47DRAFT_395870 [Echria macrotheca]